MKIAVTFTQALPALGNTQFHKTLHAAGQALGMRLMTEGGMTPDQVAAKYSQNYSVNNHFELGVLHAVKQYKQMLALILPKPKPFKILLDDYVLNNPYLIKVKVIP